MLMNTQTKVLLIEASGRSKGSVTRTLTNDLVAAIEQREGSIDLTRRDLANGVPFVDEAWITANFTDEAERTPADREALAVSDELVVEIRDADIVVIGSPIYNFGVPAALKAWVDMIARARLTFRYTPTGPVGLLEGKKAYLVVASGGVPVDSPVDFATPYLRHVLGFVGIHNVEVIAVDRLMADQDGQRLDAAQAQVAAMAA